MMTVTSIVSLFLLAVVLIALLLLFARSGGISGLGRNRHSDYFTGLNFLLNDEPDDAIDVLLSALELHSTSLETHLALSTLLRRRGNVERALEHCWHLLASGRFNADEVLRIKLSLARNFLAAGLLDRAEQLLAELRKEKGGVRLEALELALTLFQREQDWPQALAVANELLQDCDPEQRVYYALQASHFCCELADQALADGQMQQAAVELVAARALYLGNVRVAFLQAQLNVQLGESRLAAETLASIRQSDRGFAGEACQQLVGILQQEGIAAAMEALHAEACRGEMDGSQLLAVLPSLRAARGTQVALAVLKHSLISTPSLAVLAEALELEAGLAGADVPVWSASVLRGQLQHCAHYRCENCGFGLRSLHWLCPGCGKWGQVRPLEQTWPRL
jgi:lipopolysaccharide assembly protein B